MKNDLDFNEKLGFKKQSKSIATRAIHAGLQPVLWNSRAVVAPIFTSTTYEYAAPDEHYGYKNPTRDVLDKMLAALDDCEFALTFSAGVGALSAIIATLESGDGIITTKNLYGGSIRLFRDLATKMGIEVQYVDFNDINSFENSFKSNTKVVWLETPTNPLLTVLDIKAVAEIAHAKSKALLIVDNTFLTSYFQRPLELGADAVMYSLTKYMNGHSDVSMGAVVTNNKKFYENLKYYQISTGAVPSPFDCYMVIRSLKTLPLRMKKHSINAYEVAKFLETHPKIVKVFHPALKTHDKHEVALMQSYGHSGVFSFYIKGSIEESKKFFQSLKLILISESLGGVESNVSFPWMMSHADVPEKQRRAIGITDTLIRLSVGIEDSDDLVADLDQALASV